MHILSRYGIGGAGAFIVTTGLGIWMAGMIAVEFTAQVKAEALQFEINPVAEDIAMPDRIRDIKPYEEVETPPPPPKIAYTPSTKPAESPAKLEGRIPDFERPVLKFTPAEFTISDAEAQPLVRPAPGMPPRAEKSGHCKVNFDVSTDGAPFNIQATSCTNSIFKSASVKAVQRWKFKPKVQGGQRVTMTGVRNQITFRLTDERGHIIPE